MVLIQFSLMTDFFLKKAQSERVNSVAPMTGESPTLPAILFLMPPVDVAHATFPAQSTATAPTVSWALEWEKQHRT